MRLTVLTITVLALALALLVWPAVASADTIERVSVDTTGGDADGESDSCSISADGRYVAYDSYSDDLVGGDTNDCQDIFVTEWNKSDPTDIATRRVSVATNGTQGNDNSWMPSISADGRYVAYASVAEDLVSGDTNGVSDIFVSDLRQGITVRVSTDSYGKQGNGNSWGGCAVTPSAGDVAPQVAFTSEASNLVPDDANDRRDIFVFAFPEPKKWGGPNRYEQDDEKLFYTGLWDTEEDEVHSGGSIFSTMMDPEASITITFKGTRLDWIATMGPDLGKVWVSIDGGEPVLVDLSSDTELFQQVVWSTGTLDYGVHVIEIYFPDDLDADEIKPISIDALDIYGGYLMKTDAPKEAEEESR